VARERKIDIAMIHQQQVLPLFFFVISQLLLIDTSSANRRPKWTGSETDIHRSNNVHNNNVERYKNLPHTIFSPQGRLYNVEKAAQLSSDDKDESSCLVMAFKFGYGKDEALLVLSTSSVSPYLFLRGNNKSDEEDEKQKVEKTEKAMNKSGCDESRGLENDTKCVLEEEIKSTHDDDDDNNDKEPLWKYDLYDIESYEDDLLLQQEKQNYISKVMPSRPLSIATSNLIIGTGGNAVDSIVLHDKILNILLSLSKSNDGMRSTHQIQGIIVSSLLARKVADSLQAPTQNVSANSGKILSSSALIIGMNEVKHYHHPALMNKKLHSIYRIDPTGQFWDCHAAAVGRGSGVVEANILKYVKDWKLKKNNEPESKDQQNDQDLDVLVASISNDDVVDCFGSIGFDDAIKLACECTVKALKLSKQADVKKHGIQGLLVLPERDGKQNRIQTEMIHPGIIRECLKLYIQ